MANSYEMMSARVTAVEQATPQIKRFTLERADGQPLPAFTGGSHIIVQMKGADGRQFSNAYSLMSVAVDFGVTQVVDTRRGIHAALPKSALRPAASPPA